MSRLNLAAIRFLNPAPLMWDFDHPPRAAELAKHYSVQPMMPAQCAQRLADGSADLGLVPIAALAENPALRLVPGCAIASKGAIRSLILVMRAEGGIESVRTIAADTSSRATRTYVEIMVRRYWRIPAVFHPHAPDLDAMLRVADAALLIGDPALLALEDRRARESRTGESLLYLDLGAEWRNLTGLPWISAVWGVHEDAVPDAALRSRIVDDLVASRNAGLAHLDRLAEEWSTRIAVPRQTIRSYLGENIYYILDDDCLHGMREFFALAAATGVLDRLPSLRLL